MSPDIIKKGVDILVILIGLYAIWQAKKSAIGGLFGMAMNLILAGIVVLTINHALDTFFLANLLKEAGHTKDLLQGPHVHRYINFVGFVLIALGFTAIAKSQKR